jgi:hypothetical protein
MAEAMSAAMGQRPGRGQPDWLQRKYARQPADPKVAEWADRTIAILAAQRVPRHIGPYQDRERALVLKNALYDAAYKRWNRVHPDDQISLSANVTDPQDGKCYARGTCRCEQNQCRPSAPGRIDIHARVRSKTEGRAHQGAKPRDTWDYDPLAPRPRQHRASSEAEPAAAGPDPPPASLRRFGVAPPSGREQPGKAGDAQARAREPQQEGILGRLRRTLG